jgi:hypothetical protein
LKIRSSLLAVAGLSALALACGGAPDDELVDSSTAAAVNARTATFTFVKVPATWARHDIVSPALDLDAMVFEMSASGARQIQVTRMAFVVSGTAQNGELTHFQLVHYPDGLAKPGVVLGTNDGALWAPGGILSFDLSTPVTWQSTKGRFRGEFVLRVDVNGSRTFFFDAQLRTVTVKVNGVEQYLVAGTCDLPLQGDTFYANY